MVEKVNQLQTQNHWRHVRDYRFRIVTTMFAILLTTLALDASAFSSGKSKTTVTFRHELSGLQGNGTLTRNDSSEVVFKLIVANTGSQFVQFSPGNSEMYDQATGQRFGLGCTNPSTSLQLSGSDQPSVSISVPRGGSRELFFSVHPKVDASTNLRNFKKVSIGQFLVGSKKIDLELEQVESATDP